MWPDDPIRVVGGPVACRGGAGTAHYRELGRAAREGSEQLRMADRPTRRHDRHEGDGPRKGEPASRPRGLARGVRIVFEDPDILVVDKPCGMLSAYVGKPRGEGYEGDDLFSLVKRHVRSQAKGRTRQRQPVYVVHRLDREVSGLMVFAKSDRAMHWLKEDLRARRVQRHYHAVVEGELPITGAGSSGTIQSYLRENEKGVVESVPAPATTSRREGESSDVKVAVPYCANLAHKCCIAARVIQCRPVSAL